jgi:hypothetical protein
MLTVKQGKFVVLQEDVGKKEAAAKVAPKKK